MSDPLLTAATSQGGTVTPATPVQPAPAEPANPQPGQKPAWMAQLPKDLLDDPELSQHDKLEKLARSWKDQGGKLKELEAKVSTAIPGKDAKPEDWDKFYASLGRPEKPDGYQFSRDGDLKDLPKLPGMDEWTAETYYKLGFTKTQAEALFAENAKKTLAVLADMKAQNAAKAAECTKSLEQTWGRDFQAKRMDLEQSVKTFFGEDGAKEFFASPLANNPAFLDRLAGLNRYMKDAPFRTGSPSGAGKSAASVIFSKT